MSPQKKPSQKEIHHQTIKFQVIFEGGVSHITHEFRRIKDHPPYQHRSIGYLPRIGQLPQTEWQGARNNWAMKEGPLAGLGCIWVFPKIMVPPKSSILIGFSIINHPFWGAPIFGNTHMGWQVLPSYGVQMGPDWHGSSFVAKSERHKPGAAAMGREKGTMINHSIIRIPIKQPVYIFIICIYKYMYNIMENNSFFFRGSIKNTNLVILWS